ncbi:hypothetical protein CK203_034416 [Vitis vinifera]|uniref:Reverse transcriptase domain-containing protein n=1 Tax=Vitis vinifera TaxID=29760 RepID=A0A438HZH7_VITVI|nr:hypothetical protein CK203_034416 [Vitis vinifera]
MRRFAQVMDDLELVDLPLQGGSFTWSGGLHNQAWARFENMWLKVEWFKDLMRSWWQRMSISGRAIYKLATKLKEVLEMFKEFHEQNAFLKSLNNTFLVLLPKKGGTEELRDFKPISLLGGLYKLLAKVLANRIKNVIGRVVSSYQNAFVMGRQILDASLIANEFLMRVLQKMGFGAKWRDWIWSCISTTKFSVLVNGEPAEFFLAQRGYNKRVVEGGFNSGCKIRRGSGQVVNISYLLFADDTIVFCEARKEEMTYLSWILCWFEAVSGLRINLAKSEFIPVGEVEEILEMTVELGCKVGQLPSTYLWLLLGASNKASCMWDGGGRKDEVEIGPLETTIHL